MNRLLLIIDPQVDFISGSLSVDGAGKAMNNLSNWIKSYPQFFQDIIVTLDSHQPGHISFRSSWDWNGAGPNPVCVNGAILNSGYFIFRDQRKMAQVKDYIQRIGKLHLWPDHCVIGTGGHQIYEPLVEAMNSWKYRYKWPWKTILKGNDPISEMYSAVGMASPGYKGGLCYTPELNGELFDQYSEIYVAGIARDYCVAETVKDMFEFFPNTVKGKVYLVKNCMPYISEEEPEIFRKLIEEGSARYVESPKNDREEDHSLADIITRDGMSEENLLSITHTAIPLEDKKYFSDLPGFPENSRILGDTCWIDKEWMQQITDEDGKGM